MTKIGDTIFQFDINNRVYQRGPKGEAISGPIYREHFRPFTIEGETPRSWLVRPYPGAKPVTINKTGLEEELGPHNFYTEAQMDGRCWINDHRHKVVELVGRCHHIDVLKKVAVLVGYKL